MITRTILAFLLLVGTASAQQHWSYPGSITTHLQTAHGQSTAGMSLEQQRRLHDSLHEGQRQAQSVRTVRVSVPVSVPRRVWIRRR